jgi:2-polyprenyl-3-methyl-5-hydroxy-6-metoxy-1,4-benzoquinol methylase
VNQKEIRRYLNVIKRAVSLVEGMLDHDDGGLLEQMAGQQPLSPLETMRPPVPAPEIQPTPYAVITDSANKGEDAKGRSTLRQKYVSEIMGIEDWPQAVPEFCIAKQCDADQINRANMVLDFTINKNVQGQHFLDFGCGEGWIASEIAKRGVATSTGYDILSNAKWRDLQGAGYTSKFEDLKENFYDVILLYDVVDHSEDPIGMMAQVLKCLKPDGTVYVRCHPWTSRHGSHLWNRGLNKAYIHLFLNWAEIVSLTNETPIYTRTERKPKEAYKWFFKGFDIKKENHITEPVPEMFHVPAFKSRLASEQELTMDGVDKLLKDMQTQFIDYVLKPKR